MKIDQNRVDPRRRTSDPAVPLPADQAPPAGAGRLTSVELFAGAGGLVLGGELAGFSPTMVVEWNRWAAATVRHNQAAGHRLVRDWNLVEADVRDVDLSGIGPGTDLLSGGPPCQPFSHGGLGRGLDDHRDMFPVATQALSALAPRAFLFENVRGLTRTVFADYYELVLRRLESPEVVARPGEEWEDHLARLRAETGRHHGLRYVVVPTLVDAADYGVPQRRHRLFLVGFRADLDVRWSFPAPTHSKAALAAAQAGGGSYWAEHGLASPEAAEALRSPQGADVGTERWQTVRDALRGLPDPLAADSASWPNHTAQREARTYAGHAGSPLDAPAKALKAGVHGVPGGENMVSFPDGAVRHFTVREAARLQTFPDDYEFQGSWSEGMRQLGNAVPVELARVIATSIAGALRRS